MLLRRIALSDVSASVDPPLTRASLKPAEKKSAVRRYGGKAIRLFRRRLRGAGLGCVGGTRHQVSGVLPRLFVPGTMSREATHERLLATRRRLSRALAGEVAAEAYAAVGYERGDDRYCSIVGQPDPRSGEVVACILRQPGARRFLVCTANRGLDKGRPLMVPDSDVAYVVPFQDW